MSSPRLGLSLPPDLPPARVPELARRIEGEGLDELWLAEDCFFAGGIAAAGAALAATRSLTVGLGILPAAARNAAFTAMEVAALAALHPGRLRVGLGHGMPGWMRQTGLAPRSPLTSLREHLHTVRALLAGETVTHHGDYVHLDGVRLDHPPRFRPPVLAGVRGPKSLRLAGEHADGVVLAWPAASAYVRHALDEVAAGRRGAGSEGAGACVVTTPVSVHRNGAVARERLLPLVANELRQPSVKAHLEPLGLTEQAARLVHDTDTRHDLVARIPASWPSDLAIAGTPDDCLTALRRLATAGADTIVLNLPDLHDADQWRMLADEVLPRLRMV